MVKYIVGGVIVVLSWALAIIIEFPLWIPTAITLLVVLIVVLMVGIEKLKERRSARALEKALQQQAAAQAASARPDLQHEIAEMQAEFDKAVTALKGSKKAGKKALYTLPWYTIIGPPGCGKSTALRNSGLQFPYLSASGGGVRGLGGTRNCDWWMTSDAVILDTAGRWTTEDEDHEEWLGFLGLIKRFRPRKPLNGIIAAVSIGEVGGAREDEVVELARRIRERIDEVQDRLNMSLPVYVLFTKCDLIPGFVETFGNMAKEERSQVWGFTVPLTKKVAPPRDLFATRFEELMGSLSLRAPKRMGEDRKIASRELIYGFPQQLEVMRPNLTEFVHQLFLENVFKDTPLMRGVYFTSGTQEGRPIDRVMSRMAEAFGQPQVQLPEARVESKSYFLRDVFSNVVFMDAEVAVRSPEEVKRQRLRTILAAAVIFTFALGISGLPAVAWALNRGFLGETEEMVDEAVGSMEGDEADVVGPTDLEPLRLRTNELAEHRDDGPPLMMQMGMYPDDVYEPVRDIYLTSMRDRVIAPLLAGDAQSIDAFVRRQAAVGGPPEAREMREMYERLKMHIMLTRPREDEEPALNDELREFLSARLVQRWSAATETERGAAEYDMIRDNVEHYVEALAEHPELYLERNATMVASAQAAFRSVDANHMAVQGIIDAVERRNVPDLILSTMVGPVGQIQAQEVVRGAFTRRGWEEHVETMLEEDAARYFGEHWVLGTTPPENERHAEIQRQMQLEGLKSYFLEQYVQEWRQFIDSIYVVRVTEQQAHMAQLREFTSGEPQLLTRLVRSIDYNVTLERPGQGGGGPNEAAERAERLANRRIRNAVGQGTGIGTTNAGNLMGVAGRQGQQQIQQRLGVPGAPPPNAMTPARVRAAFEGLIGFAAQSGDTPEGQAAQVTPAARYEEQLEFLRDALGFRMAGTNVTNFDERQAQARELTNSLLTNCTPGQWCADDWRPRLHTLLMPPIEGPLWQPPEPPATETPTDAAPAPTPTPTPTGAEAAVPQPTPTPTPAPAEAPAPRQQRRPWWAR